MSNTKKMIYSALMIALGIVLPLALHAIPNSGSILLPMHIPVLLAGIVCGFPYGLICGVVTPLLSSFLTGMPPAPFLPSMICELAVYGMAAALLMRVSLKNTYVKVCISLFGAMLTGRVVYGILNTLIFSVGSYSMKIWLTSAFVTSLPGIAIQIIVIPTLVIALQKARVINLT